MTSKTVLVTAATGTVGKLLVRVLLEEQWNVHALVRSPDSEVSQELQALGVKVFKGDFNDLNSIRAAAQGVEGVFINAAPTMGSTMEVTHVENVIAACKDAGVDSAVYMSAYMVERRKEIPGYDPKTSVFENKATAEEKIANAGFKSWAIVRPCTFMDNFFSRISAIQFPHLQKEHALVATLKEATKIPLVDSLVIAKFCQAALSNPEQYNEKVIDLAPEALTLPEIAEKITLNIGIETKAECLSFEDAKNRGCFPPILGLWEAFNLLQPSDTRDQLQEYQVKLDTFDDYLQRNKKTVTAYFGQ
jgi:uncharacterized protein YbjT (DUF2867 family)